MTLRDKAGRNLKSLRLKAGLSQKQLADRINKSVRYVSVLENNSQNMTLETVELLTHALGVSITEMFHEPGEVADVHSSLRKPTQDFEKAINLLHNYRFTVERKIFPSRRAKAAGK